MIIFAIKVVVYILILEIFIRLLYNLIGFVHKTAYKHDTPERIFTYSNLYLFHCQTVLIIENLDILIRMDL